VYKILDVINIRGDNQLYNKDTRFDLIFSLHKLLGTASATEYNKDTSICNNQEEGGTRFEIVQFTRTW